MFKSNICMAPGRIWQYTSLDDINLAWRHVDPAKRKKKDINHLFHMQMYFAVACAVLFKH